MSINYRTPERNRARWTDVLIVALAMGIFILAFFGLKFMDPGRDEEWAELVKVGFSHPEIQSRVGYVNNVTFATKKKEGLALLSRYPEKTEWSRDRRAGITQGRALIWVLGTKDGGLFEINYTYFDNEKRFTVKSVDTTRFDFPERSK